MDLIVPLLIMLVMGLLALALVRGVDREYLRRHPSGLVSEKGLWGVVGGGFVVGFAWGALTGWDGRGGMMWLVRGVTVGAVLAAAGAFYLGGQQRAQQRARDGGRRPDSVQRPTGIVRTEGERPCREDSESGEDRVPGTDEDRLPGTDEDRGSRPLG
jgi:hypothetical protein